MAQIDGFEYEPYGWESGIARRDFRHAHGGPEELPHRAKSKGKPRKKDACPENNGKHLYVKVKRVVTFPSGRKWEYVKNVCLGCGKQGKRVHYYEDSQIYQTFEEVIPRTTRWL